MRLSCAESLLPCVSGRKPEVRDPAHSQDIAGWAENDRGVSFIFGPDVVTSFLQKHESWIESRPRPAFLKNVVNLRSHAVSGAPPGLCLRGFIWRRWQHHIITRYYECVVFFPFLFVLVSFLSGHSSTGPSNLLPVSKHCHRTGV